MHKNVTLSEEIESEFIFSINRETNNDLQPRKETLQKILEFAATYRTEKITANRFADIYLN